MKWIIAQLLILCCFADSIAQSKPPILERKITIEFVDENIPDVLSRIAQAGKFSFSYNSSIVSHEQLINLKVVNTSVREILNDVFKGTIEFRERNNHLILSIVPVKPSSSSITIVVSGYVEDSSTKKGIESASVYDKKSLNSTTTDEYGFFKLKLQTKDPRTTLAVSKRNYLDTIFTINHSRSLYVKIPLKKIKTDTVVVNTVVESDSLKEILSMPYKDEPNVQNITDTLYNDIQISFLPFLGSNGALSGNTINNYSINMFGGYSLGTRQIELGFIANIDRGNVSWLQIAGIGNLVGGDVYGIQASGFFNVNGGETKAAQLTGIGNVNFKEFKGVQLAGISNVNLNSADGILVAGFTNVTQGSSTGVQVAGFGNIQTKQYNGPQIAGITNIAVSEIAGSQVSGLFNFGKKVKGSQISLFNYADSLSGIPIGLVSIVKTGYHKLEVSADEVFYTNFAFRTGVRKFYNIILLSIKPENISSSANVWSFGYGIGSAHRLARKIDWNVDVTSQHISKGDFTSQLSLLNKVQVGLDFKIRRKLSLYAGLTLNGYLTNSSYGHYAILFNDYNPSFITDHTYSSGTNLKLWLGAKVGVRFF